VDQPPANPSPIEWRCVRTKTRSEHLAARNLRSLGDIEAFSPRLRHRKATTRGQVWFIEALFPGYVFARCDWAARQRAVLAATAVTGLVRFGTNAPPVPDRVIQDLQAAFKDGEILTLADPIAPGDVVDIAEGPLRGVRATVTRLLPARERIAVLLDFLGGTREVEIPLLSVLGLREIRTIAFPTPV
jgi:transcription antitermination factor NusG